MRWLSWFRPRRTSSTAIDPRRTRAIIEAYGACLDWRPAEALRPEDELPYSKEEIGRAILLALRFASNPEAIAPLRHAFVELERFLDAEEWSLVDEYQRAGHDGAMVMSPERREAARRILADVDERRARRRQLLAILDRETGGAGGR